MPWGTDDPKWVHTNLHENHRYRQPEGELLTAEELLASIWPDYGTFKERQAFERERTAGNW